MTLLLSCIILRSSCVNLSDNATPDQMNDFLEEITLMKAVGSHKNIVNLIGCCTKSSPNFLIVEYAAKGDLLSYLRERRKKVNALGKPEFKQNECLCCFLNELNNLKLSKCELQIQVYIKLNIKQLLHEVEHDIMNYQNRGLCYLPKPKAEADNTDTRF